MRTQFARVISQTCTDTVNFHVLLQELKRCKKVFRDVHGCAMASIRTIGVAMAMLKRWYFQNLFEIESY